MVEGLSAISSAKSVPWPSAKSTIMMLKVRSAESRRASLKSEDSFTSKTGGISIAPIIEEILLSGVTTRTLWVSSVIQ